jgi:hypothetical protein
MMNKEVAKVINEFNKTGSTIYHTGFLANDRARTKCDIHGNVTLQEKAAIADKLGSHFFSLSEGKMAHLFQKQIAAGNETSPPVYEYHAKRAL